MLYQITGAYFQDHHADSLRNDPVLNAVVGKIRRQKLFGILNLFDLFSDYISETGFDST